MSHGKKKPIRLGSDPWNTAHEIEVANLLPKVAQEPLPPEPGEPLPYSDEVATWANNWSAKWLSYYNEHLATLETWGHTFHVPTEQHASAFMELVPNEKRKFLMIIWGNWDGTPLQPEWDNSSPTGRSTPREPEPPGMAVAHSGSNAIQMLQAVEIAKQKGMVEPVPVPPKKKRGFWRHLFGSK